MPDRPSPLPPDLIIAETSAAAHQLRSIAARLLALAYLLPLPPAEEMETLLESATEEGNFVHSAGDRLIFFPHADLDALHEESGKWLPLDHLTLERSTSGEYRSHWTFKQRPQRRRRKQFAGYRHATVPPGVTPWFSILASELWGFSDTPAELWIRWSFRRPAPPTELAAVTEALVDFPARPSRETNYYQLDLWLLDEDAKDTPMRPIPWAQRPDLMESTPPNQQKVKAWAARWSLPSWPGLLCAVASSPQGQLRNGSTIIRGRLDSPII